MANEELSHEELMKEGLRRAAEEGERQRAAEKERDDKIKAERKVKRDETSKRNAEDKYRTQISQQSFDFGGPEKDTTKQDKAKARAAENAEYADKRTPKSPLIRQAELENMKEILNKPKGPSGGGGSGGMGTGKMNRDITKNYKKGGKVKSASARADGCAIRGKTRA
jgi:hypothetical protein